MYDNKITLVIVFFIVYILVFIIGIGFGSLKSYNTGYADGVYSVPDCFCDIPDTPDFPDCILSCDCNCDPLPQFLVIAKNVATESSYDREKWNCHDKSKEIVRRLNAESDWENKFEVVYGLHLVHEKDKSFWGYHAWVCTKNRDICIEATTGQVITPVNYEKRYREDR